jgi:hypothetical protein
MDVVYLGILAGWCLATWGLMYLCERLLVPEDTTVTTSRQEGKP